MQIVLTILIFTRLYDFMNYRAIARLSQDMTKAMEMHQQNPRQTAMYLSERSPSYFMFSLIGDILYLLVCVYLMFHEDTWTPGVLLLIIAALESYALYAKVEGTCFQAEDNYFYPCIWWRYACTGSTLFILTRLLQLERLLIK